MIQLAPELLTASKKRIIVIPIKMNVEISKNQFELTRACPVKLTRLVISILDMVESGASGRMRRKRFQLGVRKWNALIICLPSSA